jgi:hypothetical protein
MEESISLTLRKFYPRYPFDRRMSGHQKRSRHSRKEKIPIVGRTEFIEFVASHLTEDNNRNKIIIIIII